MKLALVASLLVGLAAAPVFAHGDHDDHGPVVKPGKQVSKDAPTTPAVEDKAATPEAGDDMSEAAKAPAPKTP